MVESMDSNTDMPSGFLISNTNLGNLLQPIEAPLTDRFIVTEDEMVASNESTNIERSQLVADSGVGTGENTSQDRTPDTDEQRVVVADSSRRSSIHWERQLSTVTTVATDNRITSQTQSQSHVRSNRFSRSGRSSKSKSPSSTSSSSSSSSAGSTAQRTPSTHNTHSRKKLHRTSKRSSAATQHDTTTSGDDSSTSSTTSSYSSSSASNDPMQLALRASTRLKADSYRVSENQLHRLFVCIAGVADQLQTNFASDLRQILRSVFLMNMSPSTPEEIDPPVQPKDANGVGDLFEFRASEQDVVIHREQREGSNQSIYSAAEEANPEDTDSVFGSAGNEGGGGNRRQERSASFESNQNATASGAVTSVPFRSRSLGEESTDSDEAIFNNDNVLHISSMMRQRTATVTVPSSRTSGGSVASSPDGSGSSSPTQMSTSPDSSAAPNYRRRTNCERTASVQPPRWIPDDEAPRCMACGQGFTTFRRRHHCRNCGGVFCGVCSSTSAPLPKYGLIKAVRVCKECFLSEVGA